MSALQSASLALRRQMLRRAPGGAPRRMMATEEPVVTWAEYRSGSKTLAEWVEGNRHKVAGGFFVFYVSLAVYQFGFKKKKAPAEGAEGAEGAGAATAEGQ